MPPTVYLYHCDESFPARNSQQQSLLLKTSMTCNYSKQLRDYDMIQDVNFKMNEVPIRPLK